TDESEVLQEAGCRPFVDLNPLLRYTRVRNIVPRVVSIADEKIARAVAEFLRREEYREALRPDRRLELSFARNAAPVLFTVLSTRMCRQLEGVADKIENAIARRIAEKRRRLEELSGPERIRRVREVIAAGFSDVIGMKILQNVAPGILAHRLIASL